jgi:protein gp37
MGLAAYSLGFRLKLLPERLDEPRRRQKPTIYFVNSMSDSSRTAALMPGSESDSGWE